MADLTTALSQALHAADKLVTHLAYIAQDVKEIKTAKLPPAIAAKLKAVAVDASKHSNEAKDTKQALGTALRLEFDKEHAASRK